MITYHISSWEKRCECAGKCLGFIIKVVGTTRNVRISSTHFLDTSPAEPGVREECKKSLRHKTIYNMRAKNAIMTTARLNDLIWVANDEE